MKIVPRITYGPEVIIFDRIVFLVGFCRDLSVENSCILDESVVIIKIV